ncbi:hypothetical protein ENINCK372B1_22405 [Enterobacter intestinihominis]
MQIFRVFYSSGKATIEVSDEGFQPGVGCFNTADSFKTHFLDKPVLECLICSLYATFSLGTVGTNQLEPQFRKYTAKLGDTGCGGTTIIDPEMIRLSSFSDMLTSILMSPWPEDWILYAR